MRRNQPGKEGKGHPGLQEARGAGEQSWAGCLGGGGGGASAGPAPSQPVFQEQWKGPAAFRQGAATIMGSGWSQNPTGCWGERKTQSRQESEWGSGPRHLGSGLGPGRPGNLRLLRILVYYCIIVNNKRVIKL